MYSLNNGYSMLLHIQVYLISISPRNQSGTLQSSVVAFCYFVQIHWRLTYKTTGLEESVIAPLTLLLQPPLLTFLPSLINRPALGVQLCSYAHFQFVCPCMCALSMWALCLRAFACVHG